MNKQMRGKYVAENQAVANAVQFHSVWLLFDSLVFRKSCQ